MVKRTLRTSQTRLIFLHHHQHLIESLFLRESEKFSTPKQQSNTTSDRNLLSHFNSIIEIENLWKRERRRMRRKHEQQDCMKKSTQTTTFEVQFDKIERFVFVVGCCGFPILTIEKSEISFSIFFFVLWHTRTRHPSRFGWCLHKVFFRKTAIYQTSNSYWIIVDKRSVCGLVWGRKIREYRHNAVRAQAPTKSNHMNRQPSKVERDREKLEKGRKTLKNYQIKIR